jgi:hypothetical protein
MQLPLAVGEALADLLLAGERKLAVCVESSLRPHTLVP